MRVESSRFGIVEVHDRAEIRFPQGIIGFPDETSFVLLRRDKRSPVAWLQSARTPDLALPVVSVDALSVAYPELTLEDIASASGILGSPDALAIMAVITPAGVADRATVNLLSPIIVNAETRTGAQVVFENSRFSTQEPFEMRRGRAVVSPQRLQQAAASP